MKYLILTLFFFSLALSGQCQNDNWIKLAEKTVAFKNETDKVNLLGKENTVNKIKLKCVQGTLELKQISIVMKGGERADYDAKGLGVLTKGMSSLAYAVPDKGGKIDYIELEYDTKGKVVLTKKAKVEIWGKEDR